MERYRSGHNEAVLKTVCPQGRVGSNPTLSASWEVLDFPFLLDLRAFSGIGQSTILTQNRPQGVTKGVTWGIFQVVFRQKCQNSGRFRYLKRLRIPVQDCADFIVRILSSLVHGTK